MAGVGPAVEAVVLLAVLCSSSLSPLGRKWGQPEGQPGFLRKWTHFLTSAQPLLRPHTHSHVHTLMYTHVQIHTCLPVQSQHLMCTRVHLQRH